MPSDGISLTLFGVIKIDLPSLTAESIRNRFRIACSSAAPV
jgi:hypothetical protein